MSRTTRWARKPTAWGGEISEGGGKGWRWKQEREVQGCKQEAIGGLSLVFAFFYPAGSESSEFFSKEGHRGLYGRNRVLGC